MGLRFADITAGEWTLVGIIFALVVAANLVRRIGAALHRNLADHNLLSKEEAGYAGVDFERPSTDNIDDEPEKQDD